MKFNLCFLFFSIAIFAILAKAHASNMVLGWTPSVSPDIAGYDVYYGTSSGNFSYKLNVGKVDSVTISNLIAGATYYFVATAYNTRGTQSLFSDQIQVVVPSASSVNPTPSPTPTRPTKSTPSGTPKPAPSPVVPPTRSSPQPPAAPQRAPALPAHAVEPASAATSRIQVDVVAAHQEKAVAVTAKPPATTLALATTGTTATTATASAVPAVAVQLTVAQAATPGSPATIRFSIQAGHQYEVQATTDLQNWTSIGRSATADADGWMEFTDPDAKSFVARFYRVVTY